MRRARPDTSSRNCSCTSGRSSPAGCARHPSSSSLKASALLTGAQPASVEAEARLVDEPCTRAPRVGRRFDLAAREVPGDHFHVAPAAAAFLELVAHGLKARDLAVRECPFLVFDDVGEILMVIAR